MKEALKEKVSFLARILLSIGFLWWLSTMVQWPETIAALKQANIYLLLIAFFIHVGIQLIGLWRWNIFMRALQFTAPISQVFRYFFIGLFGNLFLPTSIGGDLVKAYGLAHGVGQRPKVYASVVLDRLSGFIGLVLVAFFSYFLGQHLIEAPFVMVPIAILTSMSLIIGSVLFYDPIYQLASKVFIKIPKVHQSLMDMHQDVVLMKKCKRTGLLCIGISLIIQILNALLCYLIAVALQQEVSLVHFLIFAPIVGAVSFLPSIGGLGVRELGWVYFLSKIGLGEGMALSLSLISFFFVVLTGLLGGAMYVTSPSYRRIQSDT